MIMNSASDSIEDLRREILNTEENLRKLQARLAQLQATRDEEESSPEKVQPDSRWPLSAEEYRRYGRQMIVSSVGLQGCPAAAYIAGAGVGKIGMVDGDIVEVSNLHRQILHSTEKLGMKKVSSVIEYMRSLNPNLEYVPHVEHITPQIASAIVEPYDLVLDCTDNPATRYLISDTCVLLQKPLISASALRTDGQLVILNSPPLPPGDENGGPCYRCVFPKPPPPDSVVSCGEGGILGPVVGVMGVLQAVEAIKLITSGKLKGSSDQKAEANSMLLFSANSSPPFRTVRLRGRRAGCFACSKDSQLSLEGLQNGSLDYVQFCGLASPVKVLEPEDRIDARDYVRAKAKEHVLLDVREKVQFEICSLPGSINVPFSKFQGTNTILSEDPDWIPDEVGKDAPIYVVCRLGNDSQIVARKLKDAGLDTGGRWIGDIRGGLRAWREQVDTSWPEY